MCTDVPHTWPRSMTSSHVMFTYPNTRASLGILKCTCYHRLQSLASEFIAGSWRKKGGGGTNPIWQPIFFSNPTAQCLNPIPTSRIQGNILVLCMLAFSFRICKITASKSDSTKTQNSRWFEGRCSEDDRILFRLHENAKVGKFTSHSCHSCLLPGKETARDVESL